MIKLALRRLCACAALVASMGPWLPASAAAAETKGIAGLYYDGLCNLAAPYDCTESTDLPTIQAGLSRTYDNPNHADPGAKATLKTQAWISGNPQYAPEFHGMSSVAVQRGFGGGTLQARGSLALIDQVTLNEGIPGQDVYITLNAPLLHALFTHELPSGVPAQNSVGVSVGTPLQNGTPSQGYGYTLRDGLPTLTQGSLVLHEISGQPFTMTFGVTWVTLMTAPSTFGYNQQDVLAQADFLNTATWGGIASVTLADGTPVIGWSLHSDAGIDWTTAAAVPEPGTSSSLLAGLMVLGLCWRSIRKEAP